MTDVMIALEVPVLFGGQLRGAPDIGDQPRRVLLPPMGVNARVGDGPFALDVGYRQSAGSWRLSDGVGGSTGFLHADLVVSTAHAPSGPVFSAGAGIGAGYAKLSGFATRFTAAPNVMIEGGYLWKDRWRFTLRADTNTTTVAWELWSAYPEGTMRWTWAMANPGIRVVVGVRLGK